MFPVRRHAHVRRPLTNQPESSSGRTSVSIRCTTTGLTKRNYKRRTPERLPVFIFIAHVASISRRNGEMVYEITPNDYGPCVYEAPPPFMYNPRCENRFDVVFVGGKKKTTTKPKAPTVGRCRKMLLLLSFIFASVQEKKMLRRAGRQRALHQETAQRLHDLQEGGERKCDGRSENHRQCHRQFHTGPQGECFSFSPQSLTSENTRVVRLIRLVKTLTEAVWNPNLVPV